MDDKFKKDLEDILEKKLDEVFEKKFILLFNQGFEELIMPEFQEIREEMATKDDIERLERKIDRALAETSDHEVRLKKIEKIPAIAHEIKRKR